MKTWWVDANVLLRFLTNDPPDMAERVEQLLQRAERGEVTLLVHPTVVAEMIWVLASFYGYPKVQIADKLIPLLERPGLRIQQEQVVIAGVAVMARHNVDFADAFLAELARVPGSGICSFDRDFRKLQVELLQP